jgi:TolB-like protein/Flp pilus assembly protein TadD
MVDRVESIDPGNPLDGTAGPAGYLFISYASHDADVAQAVCSSLEAAGFPCWIAPRDVKAGALYADAIVRAINDAQAMVLVLSASAVASSHVGREVERAASKHRQIITFRIDAAALNPALEYFLGESQWIDVPKLGMPAALAKLAEAVGSGSGTSVRDNALTHPGGGKPRRVAIFAAILVCLVAAATGGLHLWSTNHRAAQQTVAITDKSIAVLPFTDMSEKKDQEYFADGMAEEILDLLAKIPGLTVIGRTSSFQFKGKNEDLRTIGTKLNAAYVVEGSVRKSGEQIRITAQLINTRIGTHEWSETYDEDMGDVLKVQDRIATGLVRALQVTVGADDLQSQPTLKSAEAYDLYLRGRHAMDRFDKGGFESAAGYFQQALAIDSTLIRAVEWLAAAHEFMAEWGFVPAREGYEQARTSVEHALNLDPRSGLAHSLMCTIHLVHDWDWVAAAEECDRALALEPRNPQVLGYAGQYHTVVGQWDEAARLTTASIAVDPLFAGWHDLLAIIRDHTGRLADAEAERRKTLEISPTYERGHLDLGLTLLAEGKLEAALDAMRQETVDGGRDAGLAIVYYAMGRKAEADEALARFTKDHANDRAYRIAQIHAYRGDGDEAFNWLDRAYRQKDVDLWFFIGNLPFKALESDPRYKSFLQKMNLPQLPETPASR